MSPNSVMINDGTSSKSLTKSNLLKDFVDTLVKRLQFLLPNKSRYTVAEVELDPQFLVTKRLILHNSKNFIRKNHKLPPYLVDQHINDDEDDDEEHEHVNQSAGENEVEEQEDSEFITNVFVSFTCLLESINTSQDDLNRIKERDEKSLLSSLILVRLLSDLIKHVWNNKAPLNKVVSPEPATDSSSSSSSSGIDSSDSDSTDNESLNNDLDAMGFSIHNREMIYAQLEPPRPLNKIYIEHILDVLITLFSSQSTKDVLSMIRKTTAEKYQINDNSSTLHSTISSDTSTNPANSVSTLTSPTPQQANLILSNNNADLVSLSTDELSNYVEEIDANLKIIFKYIASANPAEYYNFLNLRVISFSKIGELIPLPILQKFSPLFEFVYYDEYVINNLVSDIYNALPFIKSNSWKQAVLVYFTNGMKDQWYANPQDFDSLIKPYSKLEITCKNLFDYVSTIFEDTPYSGCNATVQSLLLFLCIGDFIELDSKPNKLRIAFNKRLKYITTILKDSSNTSNLECFESLISIYHLSARVPSDLHSHPIYKFCIANLDETHENLNKLLISFNTEEASILYENLVVSFYTAAIMIKPHIYLDILFEKFTESKENIKEVRILIKIIKSLSSSKVTKGSFMIIMNRLSTQLKSMIYGAFKILNQFETNQVSSINSSSTNSLHSDKFGIDSDLKLKHNAQLNSKKTSLDHYINEISSPLSRHHHDHQTDDLLAKTTTTTKINSNQTFSSNASFTQHTITSNSSSVSSAKHKLAIYTEEILANLFSIFVSAPQLYFNDEKLMNEEYYERDPEECLRKIAQSASEASVPLKFAFQAKIANENSLVYESACELTLTLLKSNDVKSNYVAVYSNFLISNYIIEAISDSCLLFSLTDPKFKSIFLFLTHFLQLRDAFIGRISNNEIIQTDLSHADCLEVSRSMEKILLLALCTHDIQFYSFAKIAMKWHIFEVKHGNHLPTCFSEDLSDTFSKVVNDKAVFTGFVSLHKRFRNYLREAEPTTSLYHIWFVIYNRWLEILDNKSGLNEESLVFRHFTGFLVSTSGCFLQENFSKRDLQEKARAKSLVSEFFDKAVSLLTSHDLVIRVVVKDSLSNESHSAVYHLICTKLMNVGHEYADNKIINEESILFVEQTIVIITAMICVDNDGAFVLVSLLPGVCEFFIRFISMIPNVLDVLRLKLRFCKLGTAIETDKFRVGLSGAFKLRNYYAKASADWLEQAVFFDELNSSAASDSNNQIDNSSIISPSSSIKSTRESEIAYLNIDLANESSKALVTQLEDIVLEIPDGTQDKDIRKYKDLAFGNYFSLFYKILQKYNGNLSPTLVKSKYKINLIIDNVLKCISNILQFDTDIGMQFVLPLGFHENKKIRSLFLNVFATMLSSRKIKQEVEEFLDDVVERMSELYDLYGATAEVASSAEHNLLASSLFGLFSYTKKLDKLFDVLLNDEISVVSRSTDIFRRNSTLTRLLSNFAKDYGLDYLSITLKPFIEELSEHEVFFEVEKANDPAQTQTFMLYLTKLVDVIINSVSFVPPSFEFICTEIYKCVKIKFKDAALVAVGSFIFLRFFCPAIISPSTFFNIQNISPKVKRSLMQLVKVIQNMANGSLSLLKWPGLVNKLDELNELNRKIFIFLEKVSIKPKQADKVYPFQSIDMKPIPELRYLHKFMYTYFIHIKHQYILTDPLVNISNLHERILNYKKLDRLLRELGQPKALISLQISSSFRNFDPNGSVNHGPFNEFMARTSMKNVEMPIDTPVVHNAIYKDGTPVIVVNFRNLKYIYYDMEVLVFHLLETASQVWDNKFYMVFDFTCFTYNDGIAQKYVELVQAYAPSLYFKNTLRTYYFNIPRVEYIGILKSMKELRGESNNDHPAKIYTYSQVDKPEVINSLCLDKTTVSISSDTKVIFKNVKLFNSTGGFQKVVIKIGRQWIQICADFVEFGGSNFVTKGFHPVEVWKLSDITKCETTNLSGESDEFTIYLSLFNHSVTLKSPERSEILRFLYFTTSRLPKQQVVENYNKDNEETEISYHWFARLYNTVFQGLLDTDDEVRASSSALFASLSTYYDIDFGISPNHAKSISFPTNTTDYIVGVSEYLSKNFGLISYRFFRAFFNSYDKLKHEDRVSAIMYISPWVNNVCDHIFLEDDESGMEKVSEIIRQFCKITAMNRDQLPIINNYVWKKLFAESRLNTILIDEVIAYAIDNEKDSPEWASIISIVSPSVEVCGEVVTRLVNCVNNTSISDSAVASQSKLLEIMILVKLCASLFFNSYVFGQLYLADVFFLCTLFIDNSNLQFGADLQKLVINTIQSFVHRPHVNEEQVEQIENTISYFSGQRAKMLFGMTRERSSPLDASQVYNRATSFEILCDYLNEFIDKVGSLDDRFRWRSRWSSRSLDVAFKTKSIFQGRAVLVVGILSKGGISDSTTSRIMKMLGRHEAVDIDHLTNFAVASARIFKGVSKNSFFPHFFIWPQLCYGLMNFASLYQASAECIKNTFCKIIENNQDYHALIFERRQHLEPLVSDFEKRHGFHVNKSNFESHIFFVLCQGLKVPQLRHTSLSALKQIFILRYKLRSQDELEMLSPNNPAVPYFFFIYLSLSDNDFSSFLQEAGFKVKRYVTVKKTKIPRIFLEFIFSKSETAKLTLLQAAYFYGHKSIDPIFRSKFLLFFTYLFKKDRTWSFSIYHIIKPIFEEALVDTNSIDTINSICDILSKIIYDPSYSPDVYIEIEEDTLVSNSCQLIKNFGNFRTDQDDTEYFAHNSQALRDMMYLSSCAFVEGQILED